MKHLKLGSRLLAAAIVLLLGLANVWAGAGEKNQAADKAGETTLRPKATISTSLGDIVVELNAEAAPLTVMNFIDYAKSGYYEGTVFHRVTRQVIQGGAYTPDMDDKKKGLREPMSAKESMLGPPNVRGSVAMYRDPLRVDSVRGQFFINLQDNFQLNRLKDGYGYPVIGQVIEGMEVVEKIAALPTSTHPKYAMGRNPVVPQETPLIKSVTISGALDEAKAKEIAADQEQMRQDPVGYRIRQVEKQYGKKSVRTDSGLVYLDLEEGTGAFPIEDDTLEVEFEGYIAGIPGARPFDSSMERWGRPGKIKLDKMLKGLREGIGGMREGGNRILFLPPELGFPEGMPGKVPPGATLEFHIRLLGVSRDEPDR
jgi:cyclophilin family peptidyl-prolyl cis-trans isomerase